MSITILQLNIQGLRCNGPDFDILVNEHQSDAVCLQETKLEHLLPLGHYRCGNYDCYLKSLKRNPDQLPCGGDLTYLTRNILGQILIMGDFNGHTYLWDSHDDDTRGEVIERFTNKHNLCVLNDGTHTYLKPEPSM